MAKPVAWLLLGLVSAGSMGYYVAEIWSANQPPGFSDLYAPWWGAHELFLHGRNPYSPDVAHEIQMAIYGAPVPLSADDPSGVAGGFAYPPYAALLLWPTVYAAFAVSEKIFPIVSALFTGLSLVLWVRVSGWRIPPPHWIVVGLFVFGSFPALQAFKLQNLSLVAAGLIAVTVFLVFKNQLVLAGIFLAASTFKPQFTVGLIAWFLLWTLADWRRRRALAWSFLGTMLSLGLFSEWLVPGWIPSFLRVVRAYRHYTYGHSLLDVWLAGGAGATASAALLVGTLLICWRQGSQPAGSPRFFLATSLALSANVLVIPTLAPHAQLLMLPGFLALLLVSAPATKLARLLGAAAWLLLGWPWAASCGLLLAAIWIPLETLRRFWEVPLYTSPLLPLGLTLAVAARLMSPGVEPVRG